MKKSIFLLAGIVMMSLSCSNDDDDVINLEEHDSNLMMSKMHEMMTQMEGMTPTNDPDIDFAKMMIVHHQGAIAMSNLEIQSGVNANMKAKAQSIISSQQEEIQQLQNIVSGLTADETDAEFTMELMASMDKMGAISDTQIITGDIDNDFATLMIVHHQGAIDNASGYLHHGNNEQLKEMAASIIEMQTQEIIQLSNWLIDNRR